MILQIKFLLSNVTDYPLRPYPDFHSILLVEFAQLMTIVSCYVFQNRIKKVATSQDLQHLSFGGNSHQLENQSLSTILQLLPCHHTTHQVLCIPYKLNSKFVFLVVGQNYLFAMGSLDHAKTELLNFSTWNWRKSLPYMNYAEIYSFAVFFYRHEFYVVGGKTKSKVLSAVSTFNPIKENWRQIGNLKFSRSGHATEIIGDKLYVIGGSVEAFEYCDLLNGFGCSVLTNAMFKPKDYPKLYGLFPSKCEPGTFSLYC